MPKADGETRFANFILAASPEPDEAVGTDHLARMLGVARPDTTAAAGILRNAGLITYVRGEIEIPDRGRLEGTA